MKFTRSNIQQILQSHGLDADQAQKATIQIVKALAAALTAGEPIELRGFGSMRVRERKAYRARNPKTGELVITQPRGRVLFRPGQGLKMSLAGER